MKIPGVFWVTILFALSTSLPTFLERWFPSNTFWWSYGLVVLIDILVIAVRVAWPKVSKRADEGLAPQQMEMPFDAKQHDDRPLLRKFLVGV